MEFNSDRDDPASEQAPGCTNLGDLFEHGTGTTADPVKAAALYKQACDAEEPNACVHLGEYFFEGRGVTKDAAKAIVLFKSACTAGSSLGCSALHFVAPKEAPLSEPDRAKAMRAARSECKDEHDAWMCRRLKR